MRKESKSATIAIFIGMVLIVIFVVGLVSNRNPDAFRTPYRYDYTLESFVRFCAEWWIPAGIIGFPLFLISLILSLIRESRKS